MEQNIRKTAIGRYLKGKEPKSIYSDLKRSKEWFFKWLRRYKSGDPDWYKGKSRAPHRQPNAISEIEKQRIISARHKLESEKFAQIGSSAIKWELRKSGYCNLMSKVSVSFNVGRIVKNAKFNKMQMVGIVLAPNDCRYKKSITGFWEIQKYRYGDITGLRVGRLLSKERWAQK